MSKSVHIFRVKRRTIIAPNSDDPNFLFETLGLAHPCGWGFKSCSCEKEQPGKVCILVRNLESHDITELHFSPQESVKVVKK